MIISLSGKKGSGKNTVADMLEMRFRRNYSVHQRAFADALKKACGYVFGLTAEQMEKDKDKPLTLVRGFTPEAQLSLQEQLGLDRAKGKKLWKTIELPSVRRILQHVGDYARSFDNEIFTEKLNLLGAKTGVVIVTDTRYTHEMKSLEKWSTHWGVELFSVYIERSTDDRDSHSSEQMSMYECKYRINNFGDLQDLNESVDTFYHLICRINNCDI